MVPRDERRRWRPSCASLLRRHDVGANGGGAHGSVRGQLCRKARNPPNVEDLKIARNKMPLLYGNRVHDKKGLVMTWGPSGGSEKDMAAWLVDQVRKVAPRSGHSLKDLGSRWCEKQDDQWQYMVRQATAFHELMGMALFNCVSNGFDLMHVPDGARGRGRQPLHPARLLRQAQGLTRLAPQEGRGQDPHQGRRHQGQGPPRPPLVRPRLPLASTLSKSSQTQTWSQSQHSSVHTIIELIESLIALPADDDEEAQAELEYQYALSQLNEGPLNAKYGNAVDSVKYVAELPEVPGSQPAGFEGEGEQMEWRIDVAERFLYRRVESSVHYRRRLWKEFNDGSLDATVANGTLRVKPFRQAPETAATIEDLPFEGLVKVKFVPRNGGKILIPRSASPEAAYLLSKYSIESWSLNGGCYYWSPRATDLDQGGRNEVLGLLGGEVAVRYQERMPSATLDPTSNNSEASRRACVLQGPTLRSRRAATAGSTSSSLAPLATMQSRAVSAAARRASSLHPRRVAPLYLHLLLQPSSSRYPGS